MKITVSFAWWWIPAAVTVLSLLWATFWPHADHSSNFMPDLTPFFRLVPAMFISLLVWAIAGAIK